jgi:hypothetical protein
MFHVYGWKCLLRKAIHNWVEKHGKRFAEDEGFETEMAETAVKRLLCYGFRRTGKAMRQVYQC